MFAFYATFPLDGLSLQERLLTLLKRNGFDTLKAFATRFTAGSMALPFLAVGITKQPQATVVSGSGDKPFLARQRKLTLVNRD